MYSSGSKIFYTSVLMHPCNSISWEDKAEGLEQILFKASLALWQALVSKKHQKNNSVAQSQCNYKNQETNSIHYYYYVTCH